ncbi:MAG: LysM peptidoglycan-binding domain-containing protein, partial [Bacteroidetes bacterium]|nr:LysM peptidoglycan-binding domain-containing protein [Bacteroidota bacterium]
NDEDAAADALDLAMSELGELVKASYLLEDPRFTAVYRVLVDEYERVYGPSDTLFTAFGDIFDLRNALFSQLESIEDPLLEDVAPSGLQPVGTEFPMTMNRLVESSMEFLLRERRESLQTWMKRADTYFPMIEQIFEEEGVPDELKYLAMIESGVNPRARSWASAVGMWQFIAATGRYYDLNVNAWVDDRMDPELATRAAAKHLRDLYRAYDQDWQIALAGYNCSPRCINRAKRASGVAKPTFWDIYPHLPRETRNYIPTYIAAALITSNPSAYGLERGEPGPDYTYHVVPVTGMLSLSDVASMTDTDVNTIKAPNPNLRRDTLPPTVGAFYLRIPTGSYDSFVVAYEALPESARRPSGEYIVKRGDTLSGIGSQFGVSVAQIMQKNGLRSTNIRIGQRLVVPIADYSNTIPDIQFADASSATVQYRRRMSRPILMEQQALASSATPPPPETVEPAAPSATPVRTASQRVDDSDGPSDNVQPQKEAEAPVRVVHTVRRGETLSGIASRYGVAVNNIQNWNSLSNSRINSGQQLTIYTDGRDAGTPTNQSVVHQVQRGDTLSEIATRYNVTVSQLRQWNDIRGSNIRVGQRLNIYSSQGQPAEHVVRRGDTLIDIAQRYGVSVANIKDWNNLTTNTIRVGQRLKIFR